MIFVRIVSRHAPPEVIGARIRATRRARGFRREVVAAAADVTIRTVENIERGSESAQTHERLRAIARCLGVSFARLTTGATIDDDLTADTADEVTA